ncbi:hypothetical protein Ciccas_007837, partial [Cichlidogyrus casuarinus]
MDTSAEQKDGLFRSINRSKFPFVSSLFEGDGLVQCQRCDIYLLRSCLTSHFDRWHHNCRAEDSPIKILPYHAERSFPLAISSEPLPVSVLSKSKLQRTSKRVKRLLAEPDRIPKVRIVKKDGLRSVRSAEWVDSPSSAGAATSEQSDEEQLCIDPREFELPPPPRPLLPAAPPSSQNLSCISHCCVLQASGEQCHNTILCNVHSLEQKRRVP